MEKVTIGDTEWTIHPHRAWIFVFKNVDGEVTTSREFAFRDPVEFSYAASFTTQFVRDNLVDVQVFERSMAARVLATNRWR